MIEQFTAWLNSKQPDIDNVGTLLCIQLSSEPAELIDDLLKIEAWNSRVGEMLAEANAWLDRATLYYLPSSSLDLREAERRATVEERCSDIRKVRDILESLAGAIKQRLILGESVIAFHREQLTKLA